MNKSLMIDVGHGGSDSGAVALGLKEKDLTLQISLYIYRRMKELGSTVGITRMTDTTLPRTKRTREVKQYDVCISNHFNSFSKENANGVETIYSKFANGELANELLKAIVNSSGLTKRRAYTKELNTEQDYYYMHRETGNTETVIIEYGFITNRKDMKFYNSKSNMEKVGESVVKVLCEYIGVKYEKKGKGSQDTNSEKPTKPKEKEISSSLIKMVARGEFGNGQERIKKLENQGYNAKKVQAKVNEYLRNQEKSKPKITKQLIKDVKNGKYGNGETRKNNLRRLGYDYSEVQRKVNVMVEQEKRKVGLIYPNKKVTTRRLYKTGQSRTNVRKSAITAYVESVNDNWRNEIRLKSNKGSLIGFTREQDLI